MACTKSPVLPQNRRSSGVKVAEGIEQAEQSSLLLELGCNLQQGYFYCGPVDLDQLVEYCEQSSWRFDRVAGK